MFSILNLCSEMYFLREQFIHKFFFQVQILNLCPKMYFLREQFIQNLWLLISVAVALYFDGCWIVWLLIYIFIKVFTTSKTFAILTCTNTNLRCIKGCGLLWIKQTDGSGLCFEDQYEALQISRNNYRFPGKHW